MPDNDRPPTREQLREQLQMVALDITPPGGTPSLHGPLRRAEAERIATGARAAGATAQLRELNRDPDNPDLLPVLYGQWPPRGFRPGEVASMYTDAEDRFVVSLIAGYDAPGDFSDVHNAEEAAAAAVDWFTENGDVTVFVYDRQSGHMTVHERGHAPERDATPAPAPGRAPADCLTDAALAATVEVAAANRALRPFVIERPRRIVHERSPDAAALMLAPSGDDERAMVVSMLDESGEPLRGEAGDAIVAALRADETVAALLADLGGRIAGCVALDAACDDQARVIGYDRWEDFVVPLQERGVDTDRCDEETRRRTVDSWPFTAFEDGPLGDFVWERTGGPWMDRTADALIADGFGCAANTPDLDVPVTQGAETAAPSDAPSAEHLAAGETITGSAGRDAAPVVCVDTDVDGGDELEGEPGSRGTRIR